MRRGEEKGRSAVRCYLEGEAVDGSRGLVRERSPRGRSSSPERGRIGLTEGAERLGRRGRSGRLVLVLVLELLLVLLLLLSEVLLLHRVEDRRVVQVLRGLRVVHRLGRHHARLSGGSKLRLSEGRVEHVRERRRSGWGGSRVRHRRGFECWQEGVNESRRRRTCDRVGR